MTPGADIRRAPHSLMLTITGVVTLWIVPQSGADQVDRRRADAGVTRLGLVKEINQVVPDAVSFFE